MDKVNKYLNEQKDMHIQVLMTKIENMYDDAMGLSSSMKSMNYPEAKGMDKIAKSIKKFREKMFSHYYER